MIRFTEDVGAVVDTVEVDRLAVIVYPCAMSRRGEADEGSQCRPAVDVRHHVVVDHPRRNVSRPPHDPWNAPASFERRAFLATVRVSSRIWIGILPGTVISRRDDDGVWRLRSNGIHDAADIVIEF